MRIKIIRDYKEMQNLKKDWNELLTKSNADNIFLTWEWVSSWWETYQEGKSLFLMIAEEANQLIGIAPFYITKARYFGIRPYRHIEFLGSTGPCSEYLDFILMKGKEEKLILGFLDVFNKIPKEWNLINLVSMRPESPNLELCKKYFQERKCKHYVYNENECPFIELPSSMDEYYKTLSNNKRWKFRNRKKKLEQDFSTVFNELKKADDLENGFNTFIELYRKRWKEKGGGGGFIQNKKKYLEFHWKIVHLFFNNQWLYLIFLKSKDKIIAAQYNFIYANKIYYYSTGFDPILGKYNPGSVLQLMAVEDAIIKKISEFDFLRGAEEYKYYWTKKSHKTVDYVVWKSKYEYRLAKMEKIIRKTIRFLLPYRIGLNIYSYFFRRNEE